MLPADEKLLRSMYIMSICFLLAWTSTEIYEAFERTSKWTNVDTFISKGERFTADDGEALEERICRLEKIQGIDCETNE